MPDARGWLAPAFAGVLFLTVWRIGSLALARTDLFVDEAQYWLWGQELAFGYYSKPPMIGWVIRAFTEIGDDTPFWIRLPAPLFHAATALLLGGIAARFCSRGTAVLVALAYATLPMVAVGSALISTDTIMFPFLAAALWLYLIGLERPAISIAVAAGIALGFALLSKYAAVYYVACAAIAAIAIRSARPRPGFVLVLLASFALTIAPNMIWNVQNGLTTFEHTLDNADWVRNPVADAGLRLDKLLEFFVAQFAVFSPILFGGLLAATASCLRGREPAPRPLLLTFTLPIIIIVCFQAVLSGAYANWAASAYLAATPAVVPWLLTQARGLLVVSFAINGFIALTLPVTIIFADRLTLNGDTLLLERYIGQGDVSRTIIGLAQTERLKTVVADNRDVLADLFYTGRNSGLNFRAIPETGRASNHYALNYPLTDTADEDILLVTFHDDPPACIQRTPAQISVIRPDSGRWRGQTLSVWAISALCLSR